MHVNSNDGKKAKTDIEKNVVIFRTSNGGLIF